MILKDLLDKLNKIAEEHPADTDVFIIYEGVADDLTAVDILYWDEKGYTSTDYQNKDLHRGVFLETDLS